jgi:uncharacterized protein YceK
MKKTLLTLSVLAVLSGCSSTKLTPNAPIPSPTPAVTKDQTVPAQGRAEAPLTIDLPSWYVKAPASTEEYVFVTGTAVSSDLSMSRAKAMLDAQHQLADKINGVVDSVFRQSRKDSAGTVTNDYSSLMIRKTITDTALTGHHLEDSRVISENRAYRTFVLIRYPMGDTNRLLKDKLQRETIKQDSDEAIDREINKNTKKQVSEAQITPVVLPQITPVAVSRVQPQDLNLLQVDNEEYKKRRDEALQKPGAVVGNITLR